MTYYRQVPLKDGELIQVVGCYVLKFPYEVAEPTHGFVPIDNEHDPVVVALESAGAYLSRDTSDWAQGVIKKIDYALDQLGFGYLTGAE